MGRDGARRGKVHWQRELETLPRRDLEALQLKRLKKRKLILKDQITRLESELIPDLNA